MTTTRTRAIPATRAAVLFGAGLLAAALAACGPPGGATGAPATPSATKDALTTPSPTAAVPPTHGLTGRAVGRADCTAFDLQPQGALTPLPAPPDAVVVCPLGDPSPATGTRLSPVPADLLAALSAPDVASDTKAPSVCPLYADRAQLVYAVLPDDSTYRLHVPQDTCRHYLPATLQLLTRARGQVH